MIRAEAAEWQLRVVETRADEAERKLSGFQWSPKCQAAGHCCALEYDTSVIAAEQQVAGLRAALEYAVHTCKSCTICTVADVAKTALDAATDQPAAEPRSKNWAEKIEIAKEARIAGAEMREPRTETKSAAPWLSELKAIQTAVDATEVEINSALAEPRSPVRGAEEAE